MLVYRRVILLKYKILVKIHHKFSDGTLWNCGILLTWCLTCKMDSEEWCLIEASHACLPQTKIFSTDFATTVLLCEDPLASYCSRLQDFQEIKQLGRWMIFLRLPCFHTTRTCPHLHHLCSFGTNTNVTFGASFHDKLYYILTSK